MKNMKNISKKNKLVLVFVCFTDGIKQVNCFINDANADAFVSFTYKFNNAKNIKRIYRVYVDALYPIVNFSQSFLYS